MQKARQKADSKDKTLEFGLADEMTNEMSLHGKASAKTQMAFDIAEKYKNYSIFQLRRFNNAVLATNSLKSAKTTVTDENGQLSNEGESNQEMGATNKKLRKALLLQFLECHFYLICVDKIQKCLQTVVNLNPNDAKLREIWKNPKKDPESVFYHFNHARNHLEHINKEVRKGNAELGNLEGADGNIFTTRIWSDQYPARIQNWNWIVSSVKTVMHLSTSRTTLSKLRSEGGSPSQRRN